MFQGLERRVNPTSATPWPIRFASALLFYVGGSVSEFPKSPVRMRLSNFVLRLFELMKHEPTPTRRSILTVVLRWALAGCS